MNSTPTPTPTPSYPTPWQFCPCCANTLVDRWYDEDGGKRLRRACSVCDFVHWNNPTPVLAAVVEVHGKILLARNAAWTRSRFFGLITGFMEAGESPYEGIAREVQEETALMAHAITLLGVYNFQRLNQVIIAFHVKASGTIQLSPELVEYQLFEPQHLKCWHSATGYALADYLKQKGFVPEFFDRPPL